VKTDGFGQCGEDELRGRKRLEGHKISAIRKDVAHLGGRLYSKPSLADAARAEQGEQAASRIKEELCDLGKFCIPTNEARR
jgi:hypothetical protein